MTIASVLTVIGFWATQVSQLFFKWGSMADSRWLWSFVGGNLSGDIIAGQLALVLLFRSELSLLQWIGGGQG